MHFWAKSLKFEFLKLDISTRGVAKNSHLTFDPSDLDLDI